jgi:hypothetical protein
MSNNECGMYGQKFTLDRGGSVTYAEAPIRILAGNTLTIKQPTDQTGFQALVAKFRKAIISSAHACLSVRPSVRMEQLKHYTRNI